VDGLRDKSELGLKCVVSFFGFFLDKQKGTLTKKKVINSLSGMPKKMLIQK